MFECNAVEATANQPNKPDKCRQCREPVMGAPVYDEHSDGFCSELCKDIFASCFFKI
jgi:hypothetical protein